jgi:hypothetical protein
LCSIINNPLRGSLFHSLSLGFSFAALSVFFSLSRSLLLFLLVPLFLACLASQAAKALEVWNSSRHEEPVDYKFKKTKNIVGGLDVVLTRMISHIIHSLWQLYKL